MFEAVIFDWDGTLAETRSVVVASFHKVLEEMQIKVSGGFIESRMGTSAREIFLEILRTLGMSFDEETVRRLVEKRVEAELEMSGQVRLNEDAFDLLGSLKGKVKLALASMNNKPVIDRMLTACGLSGFSMWCFPRMTEIFLKCSIQTGASARTLRGGRGFSVRCESDEGFGDEMHRCAFRSLFYKRVGTEAS